MIRLYFLFSFLLFSFFLAAQNNLQFENNNSGIRDKQGLKQGEWSGKYVNSPVFYKGNYKDGKRQGDWNWYTQSGELWIKANYINGQLAFSVNYLEDATDFAAFTKPNGSPAATGLQEKNKKWLRQSLLFEDISFDPNADIFILKEIYYTGKGKKIIVEYLYDNESEISVPENKIGWQQKDRKLNLLSSVIYKNDIPWKTIALFNIQSKPLDPGNLTGGSGTWKAYHPNGKIYVSGQLENSRKTGIWNYYNEDGKPTSSISYENDIKNGLWTEYHANGNKKYEFNCKNDTIRGLYKSFYENGNLRTEGKIKIALEGLEVNGSTFSGIVFQEKNYTVFKGVGFWKFYHEDGRFKNQYLYNNESLWEASFYEEENITVPIDFTR